MMCVRSFSGVSLSALTIQIFLLAILFTRILGSCPKLCDCVRNEYICSNGTVTLRLDNKTETVSSLHIKCLSTNVTCSDLPLLHLQVKSVFVYFCSPSILQCMDYTIPDSSIERVRLVNTSEPLTSDDVKNLKYTKKLQIEFKDEDTSIPFSAINSWHTLTLLVLYRGDLQLSAYKFNHTSLRQLYLKRNNIRTLPANCFYGLPNLQILSILYNNVENVYAGAFKGLANVVSLHMEDTGLRTMEVGTLSDMQNLTRLSLVGNQVQTIPSQLFRGLDKLEWVSIFERTQNNNKTRAEISLNSGVFSQLPLLKHVNLYNINITAVSENLFSDSNNLTAILLRRGTIEALPSKIFSNMSALQELTLTSNAIKELIDGTFSDLTALNKLILNDNRITVLHEGLFSTLAALKNLDLSDNNIQDIPEQVFANLTSLETLSLANNKIQVLADGIFSNLKKLDILYLDFNMIEQLTAYQFLGLSSLTKLLLNDNRIDYIRTMYFDEVQPSLHPSNAIIGPLIIEQFTRENLRIFHTPISPFTLMKCLKYLDLSGNNIRRLFYGWQNDIKSVKKLNLSRNRFTVIEDFDVDFSVLNIEIDLRDNNISEIVLDSRTTLLTTNSVQIPPTSSSLMLNAAIICDCNSYGLHLRSKGYRLSHEPHYILHDVRCISPSYLNGKLLEHVLPSDLVCDLSEHCSDNCTRCIAKAATNEIVVDCPQKQSFLPDFHNEHFPYAYFDEPVMVLSLDHQPPSIDSLNIHTLNLTNTSINKIAFQPSDSLKILDVSHNNLETIPEDFMKTNITLYIANNPLKCDCSFVSELERYRVGDFDQVYCAGEGSLATLDIKQLCNRTVALIGYISTGIMGGIFLLKITITIYRYVKKNWIYISRRLFRYGSEYSLTLQRLDSAKQFDLFLSFAHQDTQFVSDTLLPKLEKDFNQKVCVHSRDWIAGDLIADQIIQSVENSRRTVIVLTENFISSEWSYLEFRTAHKLSEQEGRPKVIMIVLNKDIVNDKRLTPDIKSYIAINTYITWGDPDFWQKIRQVLPRQGRK